MTGARVSAQRGFTVIEVVVAFSIFALAAAALFEVYGGAVRRTAQAQLRLHALLDAQSLLDNQRLTPAPWPELQNGRTQDSLPWTIRTRLHAEQPTKGSGWRAYDVDVRVSDPTSGATRARLRSIELVRSAT